jgi:hypothetical protein
MAFLKMDTYVSFHLTEELRKLEIVLNLGSDEFLVTFNHGDLSEFTLEEVH